MPRGKRTRRAPDVQEAIRRVNAASARLAKARVGLAAASRTTSAPSATHPANEALRASRRRLLASPGVVGVGLGVRWRDGAPTDEPVVSVFVQDKLGLESVPDAELLPRSLRSGTRTIGVDAVPFGDLARPDTRATPAEAVLEAVDAGWSPGASIGQASPRTIGTLGCFAHQGSAAFALTAMHVFDADELEVDDGDEPIPAVGNGRHVGAAERGTTKGVDAVRVRLAPHVRPTTHVPGIGDIAGWRWPAYPADIGLAVRLVGATSGRLHGAITHLHVDFPRFSLLDTIIASVPTREGDSGAALLDDRPYVLGFVVGWGSQLDPSLRIFSSAGRVLRRLRCNIP